MTQQVLQAFGAVAISIALCLLYFAGSNFVLDRIIAMPSRHRPALQQWAARQWHTELTVADLAAQVHLSPSQFAARCRDDQGMGAMAWLRGQRLAQARLLRGTGMAVAEVARRTGYRSPSALTAALRRAEDH